MSQVNPLIINLYVYTYSMKIAITLWLTDSCEP